MIKLDIGFTKEREDELFNEVSRMIKGKVLEITRETIDTKLTEIIRAEVDRKISNFTNTIQGSRSMLAQAIDETISDRVKDSTVEHLRNFKTNDSQIIKIIDNCLVNTFEKYTLEDKIDRELRSLISDKIKEFLK